MCIGSEICRDESREDAVWPTIRGILPNSHVLQRELFLSNGQPSNLAKDLIGDAVRSLNLRHAMDLEGTQQWFITIKLQFGFTYRGAKNRLAEWLVNLGRPHAIQYLEGVSQFPELASCSFQSLWRVLRQFRRGGIGEDEIRPVLESSPWIRAHWIEDLLQEAKAKIETLGIGDWAEIDQESLEDENAQEESCPVSGLSLEWASGRVPRICVNLDKRAIQEAAQGIDANELDFYIDDTKLTRWVRQKDGTWSGDMCLYAELTGQSKRLNPTPRLLTVCSRLGHLVAEVDFADFGMSDQVMVFDMGNSRIVKAAEEWLDPNRHYAILCDRQCEIHGCTPVETIERADAALKAIRLPVPLSGNISLSYGDFVLWQPIRPTDTQAPGSSIVLSTPVERTSLNARTRLILEGLPEDAESVELLIHTKTYEMEWKDDGIWRTASDVTMTPEVASRQRRIRVKFLSNGKKQTHEPRLSFRMLSAAILRRVQGQNATTLILKTLAPGTEVNRSEGTAHLRVWVPEQGTTASVFEGDFQVGKARYGKIRLKEIPGHGGELRLLSGRETHSLEVQCLDRGCVSTFMPSLLGKPASLSLSVPKESALVSPDGYALWEWRSDANGHAKLKRIPDSVVLKTPKEERTWKLELSGQPMAIAIAWKGCWLGAWWDIGQVRDYLEARNDLSDADFAILKWLRVPVLLPQIASALHQKIERAPCPFLRSWLKDSGIPEGLRPHDGINGVDFVARHFLWTKFPPSHSLEVIKTLTHWDGNLAHPENYVGHLDQLVNISPVLMWKGLEHLLRKNPKGTRDLLRAFTCARLGLPAKCNNSHIRRRLEPLQKRTAESAGTNEDRLAELVDSWVRSMQDKHWHPGELERTELAKIGETQSGRQYVSTSICRYWLMLSGEEDIYP